MERARRATRWWPAAIARELIVACALAFSVDAYAQDAARPGPSPAAAPTSPMSSPVPPADAPPTDHPPSPVRALPDYRGTPPPSPSFGQDMLWVPRVLLFPPYLVSEYLVRRPLGALITAAEREGWATTLYDFFTFAPDHKAGLVPTAFLDFGMRPSIGLYFFWDRAFFEPNDVRARVSYYGEDWVSLGFVDRVHLSKEATIGLDVGWLRRPDQVYAGEGPRTLQTAQSRYQVDRLDGAAIFDVQPVRHLALEAKAGARASTFSNTSFGYPDEQSVPNQAANGVFPLPADFAQGYTEVFESASFTVDTRSKESTSKTGVRVHAFVEEGTDVRRSPASAWLKYGGTAGAYMDVWHARVLGLTLWTELADPIGGGTIPFTEEVAWGGVEPLTGFLPGRLHGRSAVAAQLSYSWPIWVWLDGAIRTSVGNVFDAGLDDFSPRLLRVSASIGAQSSGSPDHRLEILAGFASETFDQGAKVDSVRIYVGGTNGF